MDPQFWESSVPVSHLRPRMHTLLAPQMTRPLYHLVVAAIFIILLASDAYSQGLIITDCQGITRAVHETRPTELNKIKIQVNEPGGIPNNGSPVQLTNNITGQTFTAQTNSGFAVFNGVPAGNYSMVVTGSNLSVGTITVGGTGLGAIAAGGVVAGGVAAGGGAVVSGIAAVEEVQSQLDGATEPEATPTPTPDPAPPTPVPTPEPIAPDPTPTPCDCVPDAEPTPIEDFFDDENSPASRQARALSPYR